MSEYGDLVEQRRRIFVIIAEMQQARADVVNSAGEASRQMVWAELCAAVIMITDILKLCMSAMDKRAAAGFSGIDSVIANYNKVAPYLNVGKIATKRDAMATVSGGRKQAAEIIGYLRTARDVLLKMSSPSTTRSQIDLVAKLAMEMADDTILMIDAGMTQQELGSQAYSAVKFIDGKIARMKVLLDQLELRKQEIINKGLLEGRNRMA